MSVPFRYALAQRDAVAALVRIVLERRTSQPTSRTFGLPGRWFEARLPPLASGLVRDYIRHVGGDPGWYKGRLPAHFFPQWCFPLAARALLGAGYPLARAINYGCRFENRGALPADEPLEVRARIESIDDDGRRAIITQRLVTGTERSPDAVVADLRAYIPLARKTDAGVGEGVPRARPAVPVDAREIAFVRIHRGAGLDFAKLTGDFNPIHWLHLYARAAGFRTVILHGFSAVARSVEGLNRARFAGNASRLKAIDVRLWRPLVLPAQVGIYASPQGGIWMGDAPGAGAYLQGHFETKEADRD